MRAAVFDLDGTLVDNMRFHGQAWASFSRRLGVELTAERFERTFAGKKNEDILPALLERPLGPNELTRLAEEKESLYRSLYAPHLAPTPGAREFLARLREKGILLAVATAAPRLNRDLVLDGLSLRPFFAQVAGEESAARGKPAPDIFLAAARLLGVAPEECVAFEDAESGVRAARAAGMAVVGITTTRSADALRGAGARWTAPDFLQLPRDLEGLLLG